MSVHVRDEGRRDDPVPIVLLHGTSASLHTWDGWVRALRGPAPRDPRRHAGLRPHRAPRPTATTRSAATSGSSKAMLDHFGVAHCVLVGNSFGGWVAWETALAEPGRVDALVLVDSAGYADPLAVRADRLPRGEDPAARSA